MSAKPGTISAMRRLISVLHKVLAARDRVMGVQPEVMSAGRNVMDTRKNPDTRTDTSKKQGRRETTAGKRAGETPHGCKPEEARRLARGKRPEPLLFACLLEKPTF